MLVLAGLLLSVSQLPTRDSLYTSAELRALVDSVAAHTRTVPERLDGFRSDVEAEVALFRVDASGHRRLLRVQQVAEHVVWERSGRYVERVVGHRAQSSSILAYNALSLPSFTVPSLYGARLDLLLGPFTSSSSEGRRSSDELHPLAVDRDRIYRYAGGDTVQRLTIAGRVVSVVSVSVMPSGDPAVATTVFRGELLLEPVRFQIVAMRGEILEIGGRRSTPTRARKALVKSVGLIEVTNAELDGEFWLPQTERIELRVTSPLSGREAMLLRVSSRFSRLRVTRRDSASRSGPTFDVPVAFARRLTFAQGDSLRKFDGWRSPLGDATQEDAFPVPSDADPQSDGERSPTLSIRPGVRALREAIRFNRVEGLYSGVGAEARTELWRGRQAIAVNVGRAWSSGTYRGEARLELQSTTTLIGARVGRTLESTNDFRYAGDHGSLLAALLQSRDDHDYVDRVGAAVFVSRAWNAGDIRVTVSNSRTQDRGLDQRLTSGLFGPDSGFRRNRPVSAGRYQRTSAAIEIHPDVLAEYLRPGVGFSATIERGIGRHDYSRVTARVAARRHFGASLSFGGRVDGGAVFASDTIPLQEQFELGGPVQLPGFDYKQFTGDRALAGQLSASYALRNLGFEPQGGRSTLFVPQLSATVYVGIVHQSNAFARDGALVLSGAASPCNTPGCVPLEALRTSGQVGIRLFDGGVFFGWRRRLSDSDRWRFIWAVSWS